MNNFRFFNLSRELEFGLLNFSNHSNDEIDNGKRNLDCSEINQ